MIHHVVAVLAAAAAVAAFPAEVWISPQGNNLSGNGSHASPWQSPQRALQFVADQRHGNGGKLPGPVTIRVLPGLYALDSTIEITAASSGDPGMPVTFQADDPGAPNVFSGAAVLSDVTANKDGTVTFSVPDSVPCPGGCRQLFRVTYDDGTWPLGRRNLSRSDTLTYSSITAKDMVVPSGQLSQYSPASLAQAEAVVYHSWTATITPVGAWDPSAHTLTFATDANPKCYDACENKYYVQNVLDPALLGPGEFFVATSPSGRTVTYRPYQGESVKPGDFAVANLSTVLATTGSGAGAVGHVVFNGITFAHSASHLSTCLESGGCNGQSDSDTEFAAVQLANASNVTLYNCTVEQTGLFGVWVQDGSSDVVMEWVFLRHLGAGAVRVGQSDVVSLPRRITLRDSTVSYTGEVLAAGPGVLIQPAADVTVTHNEFAHTRYTAVSAGWTWGYAPTQVSNVNISHNDMHDVFGGELSDGGCVYTLASSTAQWSTTTAAGTSTPGATAGGATTRTRGAASSPSPTTLPTRPRARGSTR